MARNFVGAGATLVVCSLVAAQQPGGTGLDPTRPGAGLQGAGVQGGGVPQGQGDGTGGAQGRSTFEGLPNTEGFDPIWMTTGETRFSGFPTFPSALQGYGNYPLPTDPNAARTPARPTVPFGPTVPLGPTGLPIPLAPAEAEPPGWPSWVRTQSKVPLPFAPDVALLVGNYERVWWRASDDEPFVPMFFYSKFATLPVGGEVEVRHTGEFELMLHTSTRIEARGRTKVRLVAMDEETVQVAVPEFTWLRLHGKDRAQHFTLPDGSVLTIEPPASEAAANPFAALLGAVAPPATPGQARVELRRVDEPGWFGGRATLTNLGAVPVRWQHAFGVEEVQPAQRVTLFLTPPHAQATSAELQTANAQVVHDSGNVACRSERSLEVQWCGARVALPEGGEVTFESLQGDAFRAPARADASDG